MNIMDSESIKNAFDGSRIIDYKLKSIITADSILKMGTLGKLDYYKSFPTRYFTIQLKDGGMIRGIEGESIVRVKYHAKSENESQKLIESYLLAV
jgi:hypothetical protein